MTFLEPARLFCVRTPLARKRRMIGEWLASLPHPLVMARESLGYFTIWSLGTTCLALHHLPFLLPLAKMMALQSSLGGGYIAMVHPRELQISYCRVRVRGFLLHLMDIGSHHLPLIYLWSRSPGCPPFSLLLQTPLLLYLLLFSVQDRYGLRSIDRMRLLGLLVLALWICQYWEKKNNHH